MWIDDVIFSKCSESLVLNAWVPSEDLIVLGSSNQAEVECHSSAFEINQVKILRRAGGGGTVVLHEGCVIVSIGAWVKQYYRNDLYFRLINQALIQSLSIRWPKFASIEQNGISDLTYGGRKVAGTSLFRSRNYLLYQASILVEKNLPKIERYLAHPSKEPQYRQGRSHQSFLMGLNEISNGIGAHEVAAHFLATASGTIQAALNEQLIAPVGDQISHIRERGTRTKNH